MPAGDKRSWLRSLAGYAAFIAMVAGAGTLAYDLVQADARPTVIRISSALAASVILLHLRSRWRADLAMPRPGRASTQDARPPVSQVFTNLHHDVRLGMKSRRYFESYLRPRIEKLAREGDTHIDPPELHHWPFSE